MSAKTAALIAFVGAILAAVLLVWDFFFDLVGVLRGLIPAVRLFPALIYAFAAVTAALFFFVFHKQYN